MTKEELSLQLLSRIELLSRQTELVQAEVERMMVRFEKWPWLRKRAAESNEPDCAAEILEEKVDD